MGVSTRSKSKLSASSNEEDQSSGGSVHSLSVKWNNSSNVKENHSGRVKGNKSNRVKGKKSGNAAKSTAGKQQKKKTIDKAVREAVGAKKCWFNGCYFRRKYRRMQQQP
jgi:hypothetical protein